MCSRGHFKVAGAGAEAMGFRGGKVASESRTADRKMRWSVTYCVVVEGCRSGIEGVFRSKAAPLLLSVVRCQVMLGRMLGMFLGMHLMAMRQMRVFGSFFAVVILMVLGGFVVMARSVLMVFRCLLVMLGCFF